MKFCENCGKKIGLFEKHVCSEDTLPVVTKTNKKLTLSKKMIVAIAITSVMLLVVLTFVLFNSKPNAFDYVTVDFEGFNTQGVATVNFNKEALIKLVIGDEPDSMDLESHVKWYDQYTYFDNEIKISVDKQNGLSNGDKITVSIDVGEVGGKIKGGKKEFTVSNLPEAELIDVFKNVEFNVTGISGEGQLNIINNSENEFVKNCTFSADNTYGLSNGDTVVITVSYNEEKAKELNCVPSATTKIITISGLSELLTDLDAIDSSVIKSISDQFLSETAKNKGDFIFSYKNHKFYKSYFLTPKEDTSYVDENQILIYISYDEYRRGSFYQTIYTPLKFRNVTVSNGKLNIKYEDGSSATFTTDINSSLETLKEKYNVIEIN